MPCAGSTTATRGARPQRSGFCAALSQSSFWLDARRPSNSPISERASMGKLLRPIAPPLLLPFALLFVLYLPLATLFLSFSSIFGSLLGFYYQKNGDQEPE